MEEKIKLRPHHLLCTQAYSGKGYSEEFVANMDVITARLRGKEPIAIELTFSTDDLCQFCPNKVGENQCKEQEKVAYFDKKCIAYFKLKEETYIYQELVAQIKEIITPQMLKDICGNCNWYPVSACRNIPNKTVK